MYMNAGFDRISVKIRDLDTGYDARASALLDNDRTVVAYMQFERTTPVGAKAKAMASSPAEDETGGIDFRILPMTFQTMGSFSDIKLSLPVIKDLAGVDVSRELTGIRRMVDRGMMPSGQRLKELLAVCIEKGSSQEQVTELLGCLVKICRLYEEQVGPTSRELREALLVVDSEEF
jgi:hypothetical protein